MIHKAMCHQMVLKVIPINYVSQPLSTRQLCLNCLKVTIMKATIVDVTMFKLLEMLVCTISLSLIMQAARLRFSSSSQYTALSTWQPNTNNNVTAANQSADLVTFYVDSVQWKQ